jgi:acetate kinase
VRRVDDEVLGAMEYYVPVAPAHNPAYIAAMRSFRARLGEGIALVAAFEPGFHRTVPAHRRCYAVPTAWQAKLGVQRYGFHGASHCYIAQRTAQLMPGARRIISVHLGGSSSLCAIRDGRSVATSMGFSPQSGLPQTTRVGDFDAFALSLVQRETGMTLERMLSELSNAGGLEAMSGIAGGDMRDIEDGYVKGDARCVLTFQAFSTAVRDYIGAYLVELGGADAIVFTGGVGQKSSIMRGLVCRGLEFAGVVLDEDKNKAERREGRVDAAGSRTAIWAMPTNEELVVARQAKALLEGS